MNSSPWAEPRRFAGRRAAGAHGGAGRDRRRAGGRAAARRAAAAICVAPSGRLGFRARKSHSPKKFPFELAVASQPAVPFFAFVADLRLPVRRASRCLRCAGPCSVVFGGAVFSFFRVSFGFLGRFRAGLGFFGRLAPPLLLPACLAARSCRTILRSPRFLRAPLSSPPPPPTLITCGAAAACWPPFSWPERPIRKPTPIARTSVATPAISAALAFIRSRLRLSAGGGGGGAPAPPPGALIDSMKTTASMNGRRGSPRRWPQLRQ